MFHDFMKAAVQALPVERPYDYHRALKKGPVHEPRRDRSAQPTAEEMEVAAIGWSLLVHRDGAPLIEHAADDFRDYLKVSMDVAIDIERDGSLDDRSTRKNVIVAATRERLPGLAADLKASKDYRLLVDAEAGRIVVCGFDDLGVMHGLYNLEARMNLREGSFLPRDLDVTRHSLTRRRMAMSWLGFMQWPDAYLSHMAHDGYDAIFASVYANPNGVPGPPHYDIIREQTPERVNDLVARAARHGLKVYAPILFNNQRSDENKAALREHVRDILAKCPGVQGYVLLTEGFYFEKFFGAGGHGEKQDLRDWARNWTEAVRIVAEECHRVDPAIEVLPWEYNIDFRPHQVELKRHVTSLLPDDTIPLLTWENGAGFELDGLRGYLRDYSISQIGPAEVASAQIDEAKRRGMAVYCKADCYATWQFGTTPYIPCPQQWQRRYDALAERGVDGTLETWSNGYKPNFVAELRAWSCWTGPIAFDDLLRATARRIFGAGAEDAVLRAWEHFSRAIQLVPDTGPSMGTNTAVANPLFFDEPPPRLMTLHNSWWDEAHKVHWRHRMNTWWPFAGANLVFTSDFKNETNCAEAYARARSGIGGVEPPERLEQTPVLPIFLKYLGIAADEFEAGLAHYRQAALDAPESKRARALKEVLLVEQMRRMLQSAHAILEFEDLRFRLTKTEEAANAAPLLDRMTEILTAEIERTEASLQTAKRDSRLGYQPEMDYAYSPFVIEQKLQVLQDTLNDQIPERRRQLGLA